MLHQWGTVLSVDAKFQTKDQYVVLQHCWTSITDWKPMYKYLDFKQK